jgi:hypothetical protein
MAPWDFHDTQDEPLPRTYGITRTLLQMEEKKVVEVQMKKWLMNQIYEESFQGDLDEVSHVEDPNETLEDEVVQPCKEVISSNDTGECVE